MDTLARLPEAPSAPLPIIMFHKGRSDYLAAVTEQARWSNPAAPILVLSDQEGWTLPGAEVIPFRDCLEGARAFARHYCHCSIYPEEFERFCFERWFILRDFMRARGLSECLHIDSDVLLYGDAAAARRRFAAYDLTLSYGHGGWCGHTCFIGRREVLEHFCDHMLRRFAADGQPLLKAVAADRIMLDLGARYEIAPLNDMRLLAEFREDWRYMIENSADIFEDTVFDHYACSPHSGFSMRDGLKDFRFERGVPYVRHMRLDREIRFLSIHCQGFAKGSLLTLYEKGRQTRPW